LYHYAHCLIFGAMLNGIRRMDPVPERTRRIVRQGRKLRYEAAAELGAMPTRQQMERLRPGYERAYLAAQRGQPLSLDWPLPDSERMRVDWNSDPSKIHEHRIDGARLRALVAQLPGRQRTVVVGHYWHEQSLRAVSERMGVSPQRASQLHMAAMRRMRAKIDAAQA
jgi:RNA polymerase sigma factor (sigma-70 family)